MKYQISITFQTQQQTMTRISKKQFQEKLQTKLTKTTEDLDKLKTVRNLSAFIQIHFYILENLSRYYINKLYRDISNLYIEITYIRFEIVVNHSTRYTIEYLQQTLENLNHTRQQIFDKYGHLLTEGREESGTDESQLSEPLPTPR